MTMNATLSPTTNLVPKTPHADTSTENTSDMGRVLRKRDDEFWFDDGSIILSVQDVEFRVYKGLLARHSAVFQTMLSLPQPQVQSVSNHSPSGGGEEACPVLRLEDSARDWRHVFRACMGTQLSLRFVLLENMLE